MLIEPPATVRHTVPKWLWVTGAIFLAAIAAGIVALATHWPFTRDAITKALEEASGRRVQIQTFSDSYFPPGCTAEGIRFLRHKHPDLTPIITIEKLTIAGSFTGLFGSTKRLSAVRVVGMHMIPPLRLNQFYSTKCHNSGFLRVAKDFARVPRHHNKARGLL